MNIPEQLVYPLEPFAAEFRRLQDVGANALRWADVAFVGLARNCEPHLAANLKRLEQLSEACGHWRLHIETNDNADGTESVLEDFCAAHPQATFTSQQLGREQYGAEFAGRRTIALAEYRTACQQWVRDNAADSAYTIVIDFDAWGGWSHAGLLSGIGWLVRLPDAYGMASVSVMEHPTVASNSKGETKHMLSWLHYDAWALRGVGQPGNYWDDYTAGHGGWKHQWLPPVGSQPVLVASAFGGLAIYRTGSYLRGMYDGSDCEHVTFHKSIADATGMNLYLNPSQRCVMHWVSDATRQHGDH